MRTGDRTPFDRVSKKSLHRTPAAFARSLKEYLRGAQYWGTRQPFYRFNSREFMKNIRFPTRLGCPKSSPGMINEVIVGDVVFRPSKIHGMGGFARRSFCAGERIIEYVGEKMDKAEAQRRCDEGNVYVFEINDEWDIDGSVDWNPARWLNQSCDANAETDVIEDRVWIIARRAIQPGEEITYNYNFDLDEYEEYPCNCGAEQCPGFMVAEKHWEEVRKRHPNRNRAAVASPA